MTTAAPALRSHHRSDRPASRFSGLLALALAFTRIASDRYPRCDRTPRPRGESQTVTPTIPGPCAYSRRVAIASTPTRRAGLFCRLCFDQEDLVSNREIGLVYLGRIDRAPMTLLSVRPIHENAAG